MATDYRRTEYVNGNTVRKINPEREVHRTPQRVAPARRNRRRRQVMDFGFVMFLTVALVVTAYTCIVYLQVRSSITSHVSQVSKLEIQLENLKAENDDYESRIKGSVDLESVKRRAMDDLGMTYASEDQIIIYESDGTDYVRQFVSIE